MTSLFNCALSFNQNINDWNISNVENMIGIFWNAVSFNPINAEWYKFIDNENEDENSNNYF